MNAALWLPLLSGCICGGLGVFAYLRDRESVVHRTLALSLALIAAEQFLRAASLQRVEIESVLLYQHWSILPAAFLPGTWLAFSLCFGRSDPRAALAKRRWILAAAFLVPALLALAPRAWFLTAPPLFQPPAGWQFEIGWTGKIFCASFVIAATLVLGNLERVLRQSTGRIRWQVKFVVLGMAALVGVRIYTNVHALLFSAIDSQLELLNSAVAIIACGLLSVSLKRSKVLRFEIFVSDRLLYRSITIFAVGAYLLLVAVTAKLLGHLPWARSLSLDSLLVILALLVGTAALWSDRLRHDLKGAVSRHLRRPLHDYRRIWHAFTSRTASIIEPQRLCRAVAQLCSETFEALSVSIWLTDRHDRLNLASSTSIRESEALKALTNSGAGQALARGMRSEKGFVDLISNSEGWVRAFRHSHGVLIDQLLMRYCIPLRAQDQFVGILSLGEMIRQRELSFEDQELLQVIADQTAAGLLNLKLSERLQQAKEMEVFQVISTFFIHDLKNLASRLSLTALNLPRHFDDPAFRRDACKVMTQSVDKIQSVCSRLSSMEKRGAARTPLDLNALLQETVHELEGGLQVSLTTRLDPLPPISVNPEEFHSLLTNLMVNAAEASPAGGEVHLATQCRNGSVEIAVSDQGCGMSSEFVQKRLFRPFQTTKKQGMGIGLYQSKLIAEAHDGRIEVESQEGKGTVVRVHLPVEEAGCSEAEPQTGGRL